MQKTIVNLSKAFVGESQARNRYSMYSKIAIKEGLEEIAANFKLTSIQEAEHAKWLMRMIGELKGRKTEFDAITIETEVPTIVSDTNENLKAAISGENHEHTSMYPEFAEIAEKEGLPEVAIRLRAIAVAEKNHEDRFKNFLQNMEEGTVFEKETEATWQCRKCGYAIIGKNAPLQCPSCGHPKAYFELKK
jgi:rubrerythrin